MCWGKDGFQMDHEDDKARRVSVPWSKYIGHRERMGWSGRVVDQGDDGAVVESDDGKRHFIEGFDAGDEPEQEPEPGPWEKVMKALGGRSVVLVKAQRSEASSTVPDMFSDLLDQQVEHKGYVRSDGTYVKPHRQRHKVRSEDGGAKAKEETDEQRAARIKASKPSERTDEDLAWYNARTRKIAEDAAVGAYGFREWLSTLSEKEAGSARKSLTKIQKNRSGQSGDLWEIISSAIDSGYRVVMTRKGPALVDSNFVGYDKKDLGAYGMQYAIWLSDRRDGHQGKRATPKSAAKPAEALSDAERERMESTRQMLEDAIADSPNSPSVDAWRAKLAEYNAKLGPKEEPAGASGVAERAEVDTSGFSQAKLRAYGLREEYGKNPPVNAKERGRWKSRVRAAAKATPEDDAASVMILDNLWTRLADKDYDPKEKALEFARPVTKSLILLKATGAQIANRPGLALQSTSDNRGHTVQRWKRTNPDEKSPQHGHRVKFKTETGHAVSGHVVASGEKGVTVRDERGGEHRVEHGAYLRHGDEGQAGKPGQRGEEGKGGQTGQTDQKGQARHNRPGRIDHGAYQSPIPKETIENAPDDARQETENNIHALFEAAKEALPQYQAWADKVSGSLGAQVVDINKGAKPDSGAKGVQFIIGPIKGQERVKEKAEGEEGGDYTAIRDVVRGTIAVDSLDQIGAAWKALEANGVKFARKPRDRMVKPAPGEYRDIITNVVMPNGHICELQINVKPMLQAKAKAHKIYEQYRSILADIEERGKGPDGATPVEVSRMEILARKQTAIYRKAWADITRGKPTSKSLESWVILFPWDD